MLTKTDRANSVKWMCPIETFHFNQVLSEVVCERSGHRNKISLQNNSLCLRQVTWQGILIHNLRKENNKIFWTRNYLTQIKHCIEVLKTGCVKPLLLTDNHLWQNCHKKSFDGLEYVNYNLTERITSKKILILLSIVLVYRENKQT